MTRPTFAAKRRAFSLVELLVTIGIIVGLLAIVTPMVFKARKTAARARMASDLQAISTALEAYKADFGDYPRVEYTITVPALSNTTSRPEPPTGAQILCWALIGPAKATELLAPGTNHALQDGNDGPGFRLRAQGKVYGPYLAADKFHLGIKGGSVPSSELQFCILDTNNNPILYLPASPKQLSPQAAYIGTTKTTAPQQTTIWDFTDVDSPNAGNTDEHYFRHPGETDSVNALKRFHILLGDYNPSNTSNPPSFNGVIDSGETAATTGPYILWSAGADGEFGTNSVTPSAKDISACDDVTNFNQ